MSNQINEKNLLSNYIKLENDTDDDLIYENSYSTSTTPNPSIVSAYKGKIEVTSKGRRKIFDGVRWQILCRRPECRKQTNKKSLCITHYKEEYESNHLSSFQLPSCQQHRIEIDDQNSTDKDELILSNHRSFHDGYIKYMHSGRRFILKNSKWQPLCKYDDICRNMAKYQSLCIKHYELAQKKQRRLQPSIFNKYNSYEKSNHFKVNDFPISSSSSSVTEQFEINGTENSCSSNELVNTNLSSLTSKFANHELSTSSGKLLHMDDLSKTDQSVQTDLSIPLCCILHHDDHSFFSSCINNKLTSSNSTKSEPQSIDPI